MKQLKTAVLGLLALFVAGAAVAQQFNNIPYHTLIGRLGVPGDTGPSQTIPFTTMQSLLSPTVSTVEACGAVGDGVTDDAPAIRTCAAQLGALAAGGKLQFSCNKTYRLASRDATGLGLAIVRPYSNVTYEGCGESSVLKVGNGMNTGITQFFVIYPPDETATYTISNFHVKNLKIDFNGANNGGFFYQNVGIGVRFGSNISVENSTFINSPGSQYVSIGQNASVAVDQVLISGNKFGSPCEIVNATCTDHSAIYMVASNYSIIGNTFVSASQSTKSTAFEMHGFNGTATGNTIYNYGRIANIVAIAHVGKNLTMTGNAGYNLQIGFKLWNDGTSTLQDVLISNNVFRQSVQHATFPFFDFDQGITAAGASNLVFSNNTFDTDVASAAANTTPILALGRGLNQIISGNTFNGGLGPCIGNGTFAAVTSIKIENNTLHDCGQTSTAGGRRGILLSSGTTIDRLEVSGSLIANVASAYMTTGIDINVNATLAIILPTNVVKGVATPSAIAGTGYIFVGISQIPYAVGDGLELSGIGAMTNGQIPVGQTGAAPLPKTASGACTLAASGAFSCSAYYNTTFSSQSGPCGTIPQNATSFIGLLCWTPTETSAQTVVSKVVNFTNLQVKVTAAPAAGQTYIFTVRKNAANTTITCTIANPNTTCSDLVNTVTFAAADLFDLQLVSSATAGAITALTATLTSTTVFP